MSLHVKFPFSGRLRVRQQQAADPEPRATRGTQLNTTKPSAIKPSSKPQKGPAPGAGRALQTCSSCGFSTRHRVLFERHARRCQNGQRPPQVVARNYRCKTCGFSTTSSRTHLRHLRAAHGEGGSIFPCDLCEYASRYRCKVLRHRKFVHRAAEPLDAENLNEEGDMDDVVVLEGEDEGATMEVNGPDMDSTGVEDTGIDNSTEIDGTGIDGIHEMEQSDDDIQVLNDDEVEDPALSGNESDPQAIRNSVPSIRSPIKATDNAFHYIQRIANSPNSQQPAYQCALCTYSNVQKWKVANHVRSFHMKKKVFKCPFCPYVTSRKIEFCIHKTKHSDKKEGPAPEEEEDGEEAAVQEVVPELVSEAEQGVSETESSVKFAEPSSSQEMSCRVCGLKVKNESKLRIHMVSHSTESVHWCPLCTLKYKRSSDLNRHMKRKHGARLRDFFFMGQQEQPLNLTVTKVEAASCPGTAATPTTAGGSLVKQSSEEQPLDLSLPKAAGPMPTENLKCSHCSYLAKWPSDLRRHLLVHSVEKRFKCPCCHRKYKYQFDLNMHLRRMHRMPAGRTKVFTASSGPPVVNVATLDSSSVTVPADTHLSDDGQTEAEGGAKGVRVNRYKLSRQQVSPQGKYKCDYCPYLGKYQSEVDRHMRLHTGEKPYSCLFCAYRSHWRGDMKRHLQKHHGGEEGVQDDITALMEQTFQPDAPPEGPEPEPEGDEDMEVTAEPLDLNKDSADPEEGEEGPLGVEEVNGAEDGGSNQDGMEFITLTPTSSSGGSTAASPSKTPGEKRPNLCPYCPFTCEAPSKLKCHMEIHENLKRFKCAHCGKRSNWTWDVRKHIKKEHPKLELNVIVMEEDEARETLSDYLQSHVKVVPKREVADKTGDLPTQVPLNRITDQLPPVDVMGVLAPLHPSNLSDGSFAEEEEEEGDYAPNTPTFSAAMRHPSIATKRCRPFKCSKCGRRSNWKWDMNKHIRNVHPNAKLIELTPDEARATMPKGGFKNANVGRKENMKVSPIIIKPEHVSPQKTKHNHQFDSNRTKKFKCSACPYRSDYRSDIGRHLKRLHRPGTASILMLSDEEARATLQEYKDRWVRGKFVFSPAKEKMYEEVDRQNAARRALSSAFDHNVSDGDQGAPVVAARPQAVKAEPTVLIPPCTERTKRWKCPKCSYQNPNKKMVMRHMRQHPKVKVFQCRMCGEASDYRNSMYRHVRNRHNSTDYSGVVHESIAYVTTVVKSEPEASLDGSDDAPVTYRCKLCAQTSSWKSGIMRHVAETHQKDKVNSFVEVIQVSNILPALPQQVTNSGEVYFMSPDDAKQLRCDVCPYRTNKSGLLKIHKTYHRPQPGNKFKCKYCPYYVSAMRLLHQHVRLHLHELPPEANNNNNTMVVKAEDDDDDEDRMEIDLSVHPDPATSITPVKNSASASPSSANSSPGRRYYCDQCPAVSRNKNDFLYHKQFHRPKPSAPYKCKLCNYWVSQRRLLRQHERVHLTEYIEHYHNNNNNSPKPEVLKTYADRAGSVPQMVLASPAKSDLSDYGDPVQVASLKQQIIASKVTPAPITPQKYRDTTGPLRDKETTMPGYMVDQSGYFLSSGTLHKLHRCTQCPFTALRAAFLDRHAALHTPHPDHARCPYCTFHAPNKKLLARHIKVHSTSYQPGRDDVNDVDVDQGSQDEGEDGKEGDKPSESDPISASLTPAPLAGQAVDLSHLPGNSEFYVQYHAGSGQHVMERASFKKWCCEKCPYATMKRAQFERHITLHGSGQKYVCEYCDYSVPAYHLLLQHKKLHLHPNPNLLTAQSIANLTRLPTVPADRAAAAVFPADQPDPASCRTTDGPDLFENSTDFSEPKKLYRCDRCPYTNVRRDHLLSHLRFHMVASDFKCPYCDYSVSKQHLLVQHIKVHFTAPGSEGFSAPNAALNLSLAPRPASAPTPGRDPGPEGDEEDSEARSQPEYIDLAELSRAGLLKPVRAKDDDGEKGEDKKGAEGLKGGEEKEEKTGAEKEEEEAEEKGGEEAGEKDKEEEAGGDGDEEEGVKRGMKRPSSGSGSRWVCQYCDRPFKTSEDMLRHETQHLVGNNF